jgi:hypothetical protein
MNRTNLAEVDTTNCCQTRVEGNFNNLTKAEASGFSAAPGQILRRQAQGWHCACEPSGSEHFGSPPHDLPPVEKSMTIVATGGRKAAKLEIPDNCRQK